MRYRLVPSLNMEDACPRVKLTSADQDLQSIKVTAMTAVVSVLASWLVNINSFEDDPFLKFWYCRPMQRNVHVFLVGLPT